MPVPVERNTPIVAETQATPTYGGVAARGVLWLALGIGIARVAALASAWVLGWLLSKGDFAVYGLAMAIWSMTNVLRDGGMTMVLIQRGQEFGRLARPILTIALLFNAVGAVGLMLLAKPASVFFDAPPLAWLLMMGALGMIMNSPVSVLRARLSVDLSFKTISRINALSAIVRHGSLAVFAIVLPEPYKVLCFGFPMLTVAVFENLACWHATRWVPRLGRLTWDLYRELFRDARWIMLGAFAVSIILQGEKLIFGKFVATDVFALYFFGWQLTGAIAMPVSMSLPAVLMPTLTQLENDPGRQALAYLKIIRTLVFGLSVFFLAVSALSEPAIQFLWQGKWDEVIPAVQCLSAALAIRLLSPVAISLVEARGRWRLRAGMLALDSAGTVMAGVIGACIGNLMGIVLTMMVYRVLMVLVQCAIAGSTVGLSIRRTLGGVFTPVAVFLAVGAVSNFGTSALLGEQPPLLRLFASAAVYGGLSLVCTLTIMRSRLRDLITAVRDRRAVADPGHDPKTT